MTLKEKLQLRSVLRLHFAVRNVLWVLAVAFVVAGLFVSYERVPLPYVGVLLAFCAYVYGRRYANAEHRRELEVLGKDWDLEMFDRGQHQRR